MSNYIKSIVFCEGCLSTDRKLTDIGDLYDTYIKFLDDETSPSTISKSSLLCWECKAMLKNIHKFRERVKQANNYLNEGLCNIKKKKLCLSNLYTSNQSENIIYTIYNERSNDAYDLKQEDIATPDNFDGNDSLFNEISKDEFKTEENESDFENEIDTDDVSYFQTGKVDIDKKEDTKNIVLEECGKEKASKSKYTRRVSYTNVRYTVNELNKEDMRVMRKNCTRILMDDSEIMLWREKMKLARNYRVMEYKCETCISGFARKEYYDRHVQKYHSKSNGEYSCHICQQTVPDGLVARHIRGHSVKYSCSVCALECYPTHNLDTHLAAAHKTTVQCMLCPMRFRHRAQCNSHYIREHLRPPRLECDDCGNGFTSKKRLINHIKHSPKRMNKNVVIKKSDTDSLESESEQPLAKKAKLQYDTLSSGSIQDIQQPSQRPQNMIVETGHNQDQLNKTPCIHMMLRHTVPRCKICDRVYKCYDALKRHNLVTHVKSASEHTYCVECNMQFNNDYLFQQHLKQSSKHRQKRFPCPECDKVYHKRTTLNNHYNYIHLQKTKNYCELCDRYFLTGFRLRQHKAHTHDRLPKPKTKMCSICGRAFNTNRILQNHMRTHTGERPFHCEHCTASFTQKNALVSHTRAIHKIS